MHREEAIRLIGESMDMVSGTHAVASAAQGIVSALLAIEARLGELVEQQQTATLLAGSAYGLVTPAFAEVIMSRAEAEATARLRAETSGGIE